jgi:hypothetical protein
MIPNAGHPGGATVIAEVLASAGARPQRSDTPTVKNQYAIRFAASAAVQIAAHLQSHFPGILATAQRDAGSVSGKKQLDINFSTSHLGLGLGISLKSVHIRDVGGSARYTHNMKRNEEEFRIEASGYHKRQPYAVMVAVLFLPFDSCDDGKGKNPSSFGSWVRHLRPYAGRTSPVNDVDRFEKIYIGLYQPDGSDLRFFDVQSDPPKQGRPKTLLLYGGFLDAVHHEYLKRNKAEFRWAEGDEEPLEVETESGIEET